MLTVLCIAILAASVDVVALPFTTTNSTNWAVLVAGSNGYYNYRHQADIAHSYQILTKLGGFPKENVIVMMYNDVVNDSSNPFPGHLYNEPGGNDVYDDIAVDYAGEQVTAENFLNVIQGIRKGDTERGKVLSSKATDNVFIYYSDHGATGLVAMPTGDPLYATDLNNALNEMYNKKMYSQLVFYLEACESGSMFSQLLSNTTDVFATTAATPDQPSYAYYYNNTLATYMADEYSIRWMQDSTQNWDKQESLIQQYQNVAAIVQESQPQQYGDDSFDEEQIEDFEAYQNRDNFNNHTAIPSVFDSNWRPSRLAVSSRDVKLSVLQMQYLDAKDIDSKLYYAELVEKEMEYRLEIDLLFDELIKYLLGYDNAQDNVLTDDLVNGIKYDHIQDIDFECLKYVYPKYEENCERFTDYSLQYVNTLVNLCHLVDEESIEEGLQTVCYQ